MNMIRDLLTERGFSEQQAFEITYQAEKMKWAHRVTPFVSNFGSREGYLLVSVGGRELPHLLKGDFLTLIMEVLGKQEFYSTEMDRNITLLLLCKRADDEQIDHDAKVRIEDDPYYFKKYVFVYSEKEETAAQAYAENREGTLADMVRGYLINTGRFAEYKKQAAEERKRENEKPAKSRKKAKAEEEPELGEKDREYLAYKFFVELATKVTVLPIHPEGNMPIRSVEDYWQEELRKTPVTNLAAVESILEMDADDLDEVLAKWNDLNRIVCE